MESWLKRLVLACLLASGAPWALAADDDGHDHSVLDDVISPDIERRKIDDKKIDSENIEIGFFAGVLSVEDFGSNDVFGARGAFHVSEDIFVEANIGLSTLQKTSYEILSGDVILLTDEQRELIYYNVNVGWNLMPGEIYIGKWAFHSNLYVIGGAGNTNFADNEYLTYLFGGGVRLFMTDWLSFHMDFRNHVMEHSIFGDEKKIQNLESHIGFTLFL